MDIESNKRNIDQLSTTTPNAQRARMAVADPIFGADIGKWMLGSAIAIKKKAGPVKSNATSLEALIADATAQAIQRTAARRQAQIRAGKIPKILTIMAPSQKSRWLEGQTVSLTEEQKTSYNALSRKTRKYSSKRSSFRKSPGRSSYRKKTPFKRSFRKTSYKSNYRRNYRR